MAKLKKKDLKVRELYIYDPDNYFRCIDMSIKLVRMVETPRFLSNTCVVSPINTDGTTNEFRLNVEVDHLAVFDPINPNNNVVVRYPSDMPTFNQIDYLVFSKLAKTIVNSEKLYEGFSPEEMIVLNTMLDKIKFYAELAYINQPADLPKEDSDGSGGSSS